MRSQPDSTVTSIVDPNHSTPEKAGARFCRWIRATIATAFWLYVCLKLFVFDVDVAIIQHLTPELSWLLDFKFFFMIGAFATCLLIFKRGSVALWIAYIVAFPFIIAFWHLPLFVFRRKSWPFAVALLNSVVSFFRSFKSNFVGTAIGLIAFVILVTAESQALLLSAAVASITLLLIIYVQQFTLTFRPITLFRLYTRAFTEWRKFLASNHKLEDTIRNVPVARLQDDQIKKWAASLEASVLYNRGCLFFAKKLREYERSGFILASGVLTALALLILTTLSFAAVNFGIYKIDAASFEITSEPSFFSFFYYSFNALLFNSIKEITPNAPVAQVVAMLENLFAFLLGTVIISLIISVRRQRYIEELNEVITSVEAQGYEMEKFIRTEYQVEGIDGAVAELGRLKASMVQIIMFLTRNLN